MFDVAVKFDHAQSVHSAPLYCYLGGRGITVRVNSDSRHTARYGRLGRRCFHDIRTPIDLVFLQGLLRCNVLAAYVTLIVAGVRGRVGHAVLIIMELSKNNKNDL